MTTNKSMKGFLVWVLAWSYFWILANRRKSCCSKNSWGKRFLRHKNLVLFFTFSSDSANTWVTYSTLYNTLFLNASCEERSCCCASSAQTRIMLLDNKQVNSPPASLNPALNLHLHVWQILETYREILRCLFPPDANAAFMKQDVRQRHDSFRKRLLFLFVVLDMKMRIRKSLTEQNAFKTCSWF